MAQPKWMHRWKWLILSAVTALLCICTPPAVAHFPQLNHSILTAIAPRENSTQAVLQKVQDLQAQGYYHRAAKQLMAALQIPPELFDAILREKASDDRLQDFFNENPSRTELEAWRTLGEILRVTGAFNNSKRILQYSLETSQTIDWQKEIAANLVSLGNTQRAIALRELSLENKNEAQQNYQKARDNYYKQVLQMPETDATRYFHLQAKLNLFNLIAETPTEFDLSSFQQPKQIQDLQAAIRRQLESFPANSDRAIAARIDFARTLTCLKLQTDDTTAIGNNSDIYQPPIVRRCHHSQASFDETNVSASWQDIAQLLSASARHAKEQNNTRLLSYGLGYLGQVYEIQQQWSHAKTLTDKAMGLAQSMQAWDVAYHWQWQQGRLQILQDNREKAIDAYTAAYNSLQEIRQDLAVLHEDIQFNFREEIEPIYRELVDLLLDESQPGQERLEQARFIVENLQVAQINDFFREACTTVEPEQIDSLIDNSTIPSAAIYAIALPRKLAVIVKLPNQDESSNSEGLLYYSHDIGKSKLEKTVNNFVQEFKDVHFSPKGREIGKKLYDWLLLKAEDKLQNKEIENLVFIIDTKLQRIPMAALIKDGDYLVRDYSVTLAPGLQLLQSEPLNSNKIRVLGAGVSEQQEINGQNFSALPKVKKELNNVREMISNSEILLNQNFKKTVFQNELSLDTFPIIHIATHGQFSSNIEETYVVAYGDFLRIKDLESAIQARYRQQVPQQNRNNIELLILTACETAKGDERATLGLAGLSVRAGARSTIASLRRVEEAENIYFIEQFYNELLDNPNISKAKALQQAQIALLERGGADAPYHLATYVLVGNWE